MKKIIEILKTKKSAHYIIIVVIGLLISIPFIWLQIRDTQDGWLHVLRVLGLNYSLSESSFPFLVAPYYCCDWGYAMLAFYQTIVTYVPYLLGLISGSTILGIKLFAVLTTILAGVFMYNFVNEVTKKKAIALFAAIFYMCFPYKLEVIYHRFAIGEFTALAFIPLVFQGLYNLLHGDRSKHYYIAIGATGLMLSHSISTEYTAIFCAIYILFNIKKFLNKDVIKKCVINVVFILLMSSMFILPVIEFESSAHYAIFDSNTMRTTTDHLAYYSIEPWQFLKDKQEEDPISFVVGIPFIITLMLGLFAYKKIPKNLKSFYITNIIFGIVAMWMCTTLFPWRIFPDFMGTLQYPWRLLGFAYFFLIPVCAINLYYTLQYLKNKNARHTIYVIAILILLAFTAKELSVYKSEDTSLDEKYLDIVLENPRIHYFSINREYLPQKAIVEQRGYLETRTNETYVISGEAEILSENKEDLHLEIELKNATKDTELELPYLFYPGYRVVLQTGDKEIELETMESDYGFLEVTIPEDIAEGKITVDYTATTLDKAAYIISGVSLVGFVVYVIVFRRNNKKKKALTEHAE